MGFSKYPSVTVILDERTQRVVCQSRKGLCCYPVASRLRFINKETKLSDLQKMAHFEVAELWLGTQTSSSSSLCFQLYWDAFSFWPRDSHISVRKLKGLAEILRQICVCIHHSEETENSQYLLFFFQDQQEKLYFCTKELCGHQSRRGLNFTLWKFST